MCGICGIVGAEPFQISEDRLIAMRDAMVHRGPDDAGVYHRAGVGLASRRLAILDLSERGRMPMSTPDGRYTIVYNGEVYNFRELRATLESKGVRFRSQTDTEVLLHLYREEGPGMLHRLNGMFALAIWDARERTLFLARDRLGIKPLVYAIQDGVLFFASEEKALFAASIRPEFDADTWEELLLFRYVAGERTPYKGVRRLLPGHTAVWRDGILTTHRYWHLAEAADRRSSHMGPVADWFRNVFDSAVDLRRISDVPVGVLLSGGLDSASVAASLARQVGGSINSFTVRFADEGYDEGVLAKAVAERWNLAYHDLFVSEASLWGRIQQAAWLNDAPPAHGSDLFVHAISEYAKPRVTVLLSGEGADEVLGGYVRYRPLAKPGVMTCLRPSLTRAAAAFQLNGRVGKLARFLSLGNMRQFVFYNACDVLPADLRRMGMEPRGRFEYRESVLAEAEHLYPADYVRQAMYLDQHTFLCSLLDRNDRMTMGASIECRVPFLDYRLVEVLASLPSEVVGDGNKRLLREALGSRLPAAVLRGRKWGFAVPWSRYLRHVPELRTLVQEMPNMEPVRSGPLDTARVRSAVEAFLRGSSHDAALVQELAMITVWYQRCVAGHRASAAFRS
ncbi:MAG: asparagine synthase (glutamine-hydrolyzing) [Chthonomonadales bacterium]